MTLVVFFQEDKDVPSVYRNLKICCETPPRPHQVGSMVSISASHTVGRGLALRPGHTKDHHKNSTNCLPAWHACVR